jgi:hypothetical protein
MKHTLETLAIFTLGTLIAGLTTVAALGSDPFMSTHAPVHATAKD